MNIQADLYNKLLMSTMPKCLQCNSDQQEYGPWYGVLSPTEHAKQSWQTAYRNALPAHLHDWHSAALRAHRRPAVLKICGGKGWLIVLTQQDDTSENARLAGCLWLKGEIFAWGSTMDLWLPYLEASISDIPTCHTCKTDSLALHTAACRLEGLL